VAYKLFLLLWVLDLCVCEIPTRVYEKRSRTYPGSEVRDEELGFGGARRRMRGLEARAVIDVCA